MVHSQHRHKQDAIAKKTGYKLKSSQDLSDIGWLRITGGCPWNDSLLRPLNVEMGPGNTDKGTQAQLNTLFDLRERVAKEGEDTFYLDLAIERFEVID